LIFDLENKLCKHHQLIGMITIRRALPEDADFIAKHAYRLLEFNLPSWRRNENNEMTNADINHISSALFAGDPDDCVFIAVDEQGGSCGFVRMLILKDYYTSEPHAHIGDIVVIGTMEGKGVGKLLFEKAEEWAKEHKVRWITLNVFEQNAHARAVYEKAGYKIEWIKYLKELDE
jgi:GNAT superfamily N-acetyltransferase